MTTEPTRSIEDRLLVIETTLPHLATKADLQEAVGSVSRFVFTVVAPIYLLLIAQLAAGVWYFATH